MDVTRQDVALADLHPFPRNYNRHSPAQIAKLAKSLSTFGQIRSIAAWLNPDDALIYILAGHGVVEAARSIDMPTMRADVVSGCNFDTAMAYVVADNELARQSDPDQAQLAAILEELQAKEPLLVEAAGYSAQELEQLLHSIQMPEFKEYDESIADEVEWLECPECGHKWPA